MFTFIDSGWNQVKAKMFSKTMIEEAASQRQNLI